MIRSIRQGLKRLHDDDEQRGVITEHADNCAIFWRGLTRQRLLPIWMLQSEASDVDYVDTH